jgi:hypothetical protein
MPRMIWGGFVARRQFGPRPGQGTTSRATPQQEVGLEADVVLDAQHRGHPGETQAANFAGDEHRRRIAVGLLETEDIGSFILGFPVALGSYFLPVFFPAFLPPVLNCRYGLEPVKLSSRRSWHVTSILAWWSI